MKSQKVKKAVKVGKSRKKAAEVVKSKKVN
jgi:hypothetical protein